MVPVSAPGGYAQADPSEIRRALTLLHEAGEVFELRILRLEGGGPKKLNRSGFFNDFDAAVREAARYTPSAEGVYTTLNPVGPELLARSPNHTRSSKVDGSAKDSDVLRRRWLVIDLDPERPKHVSATAAERTAAERRSDEVGNFLASFGFPDPVLADSGNGRHLLYRVDLPADDGGLLQRFLSSLDGRFSDSLVKVDTVVYNPSRICKLYGTIARKGVHHDERPHRLARIISVPPEARPVPEDLIRAVADESRKDVPVPRRTTQASRVGIGQPLPPSGFDIQDWIQQHGLSTRGPSAWTDSEGKQGRRWVFDVCPWNAEHTDRSAYIVQMANGSISAGCHHKSCSSRTWADLRGLVEATRELQVSPDEVEGAPFPENIEFPESAWIGHFGRYRDLIASSSESPVAFQWASLAGCLSFLIGRTVSLEWGVSRMYPLLFPCLVGPTASTRKSTAIDDAIATVCRPLKDRLRSTWKYPGSIIVGSGSGEGFAEALASDEVVDEADGKRALFVIHELGGLLEKIGRDQAGNMVEFVIAAFDARSDWGHRTRSSGGGSPLKLPNAIGVFLCATTEAWLVKTLRESQIRAGLMNRILWLSGPRGAPIPLRPAVPPDRICRFREDLLSTLQAVRNSTCAFSSDARALWNERYRKEYYRETESDLSDAASARADVLALRTAMLLAVADNSVIITAPHVEAAWRVVEHSRAVSERIVAKMSEHSIKEAETRVVGAIRRYVNDRGPSFTRAQIWQRLKGAHGMPSETFNRVFKALVEAGALQSVPGDGRFEMSR